MHRLLDRLRRLWFFVAPRFSGLENPMSIQTHVSAIETAFLEAEAFVATLDEGPLKDSASAHLSAAHEAAYAEFKAFTDAGHPETEGVALRGGGTDK